MNKVEIVDKLIEYFRGEDSRFLDYDIPNNYNEKRLFLEGMINLRLPLPIDESILKLEDSLLQLELKEKEITDVLDLSDNNKIVLWQGDITTLKCDAIVNACNSRLLGCFIPNHFCIDRQIHSNSGIRLRLECNSIMQGKELEIGKAILTKGYNLPSKYVIETVGPIVSILTNKEREALISCYKNSLDIARCNNIRTIAFPCISTGLYRFPKEEAAMIAVKTVKDYLEEYYNSFDKIVFNVFSSSDYEIYEKELGL